MAPKDIDGITRIFSLYDQGDILPITHRAQRARKLISGPTTSSDQEGPEDVGNQMA